MGLILIPGTCRQCGCTETDACVDENGLRCGWLPDCDRTLCTFCGDKNLEGWERSVLEDLLGDQQELAELDDPRGDGS